MEVLFDNFVLIHNYHEYNSIINNQKFSNTDPFCTDIPTFIYNGMNNKFKSLFNYLNIISQYPSIDKQLPKTYRKQIEDALLCEITLTFLYTAEYLRHSAYRLPLYQVFYEYKKKDRQVYMPSVESFDNSNSLLIETIFNLQDTAQFEINGRLFNHFNQTIPGEYINKCREYAENIQKHHVKNSFSCIFQGTSNNTTKYFLPAWLYPIPVIIHNNQKINNKQKFEQLYTDINIFKGNSVNDILIRYKLEHLFHHRQLNKLCETYLFWKKCNWPYPTYGKPVDAFPNEILICNSDFFSLFKMNYLIDLVPFINLFIAYSWIIDNFYGKSHITYHSLKNYLNECLQDFNTLKKESAGLFASLLQQSNSLQNISDKCVEFLNKSSYFNTLYSGKNYLLNYKDVIDSKATEDKNFKKSIQQHIFSFPATFSAMSDFGDSNG